MLSTLKSMTFPSSTSKLNSHIIVSLKHCQGVRFRGPYPQQHDALRVPLFPCDRPELAAADGELPRGSAVNLRDFDESAKVQLPIGTAEQCKCPLRPGPRCQDAVAT